MSETSSKVYEPIWDRVKIIAMSDAELLFHYQSIKAHLNLVDTYYLTEICKRRLLEYL